MNQKSNACQTRITPLLLKSLSRFSNWTMNPRLGFTGRDCRNFFRLLAIVHLLLIMAAAVTMVADLLRPTKQFTITSPPDTLASAMNLAAATKYAAMLAVVTSSTWNWNSLRPRFDSFSVGSQTSLAAVLMMWVTPSSLMKGRFLTVFPLARINRGMTWDVQEFKLNKNCPAFRISYFLKYIFWTKHIRKCWIVEMWKMHKNMLFFLSMHGYIFPGNTSLISIVNL